MNTKEAKKKSEIEWAIEYLKTVKHDQWIEFHYINEAIPIIIDLLQQGEKYEKMWDEIQLTEYPPDVEFIRLEDKYLGKEATHDDKSKNIDKKDKRE